MFRPWAPSWNGEWPWNRRVISLCDDRHIFTERYLQRREYHENEAENVSTTVDDGGRPATKDIKLKAEMARDGQLSRRIARKWKFSPGKKPLFAIVLFPRMSFRYTKRPNSPTAGHCQAFAINVFVTVHLPVILDGRREERIVCQKPTGRKIRSPSSSFFLSVDRVHSNYQASIFDRDQMGGISDKRRYRWWASFRTERQSAATVWPRTTISPRNIPFVTWRDADKNLSSVISSSPRIACKI